MSRSEDAVPAAASPRVLPWFLGVAVAAALLGIAQHQGVAGVPEAQGSFLRVRWGATLGPAEPWRVLTAPWLHGDLAHLAGNALGVALLGGACLQALGRAGTLGLLASGCLAGGLGSLLLGARSLGASAGVHALAGGLLRVGPARSSRLLGLAWILLGLLGGLGRPEVDLPAHLLGAAWGLGSARAWARARGGTAALVGGLLLLGLPLLAWRLPPARRATREAAPALEALAERARVVRETVG